MDVVPTLAPSMTASAGPNAVRPETVNEVAIRPVAVLLCNTAVTPTPTRNARQRCCKLFPASRAIRHRIRAERRS